MALRQREWARKTREKLFDILSRKCNHCGTTSNLSFDVILPTPDRDSKGKPLHHQKMEWSWRMSYYRKQLELHNLQVLCDKCNTKKMGKLELVSDPEVNEPF